MTRFALVVDDDPTLLGAMIRELARIGFEAIGALHYEAAVALLRTRRPTLVCVDLQLPTLSGYELCEHIRGPLGLADVPILVLGASSLARDMADAEEVGANAFLRKPFSMHQLHNYVEALFHKPHRSEPHLRRLQL